ncbi:MAG: hypothetical protein AB7F78_25070 [Hyphomicrobiaceae bacterium]
MLPKEADTLPLADLVQMRDDLEQLIRTRREEAATEARKALERTADELGMSVRQLVNGATATRRPRKAKPNPSEGVTDD